MNVAIPRLKNIVAPCFEAAKCIEIFIVKDGIIKSSKIINCSASDAIFRIKLFHLYEIKILVCNGIKNFYIDQLRSASITVIPKINETVDNAIKLFVQGKLKAATHCEDCGEVEKLIPHEDLVQWAETLFLKNGYDVSSCLDDKFLLVDLIAKIKCPICNRNIEVAICCGAQTYRADQELIEFHHMSKTQYDARVYVHKYNPNLEQCCFEYGIEFLSPDKSKAHNNDNKLSAIPILQIPIEGHEKAFN